MSNIMKENMEDLFSPNLWLAIPAEMIGTLVITLFGCGTWVEWVPGQTMDVVRIALTFGLAVGTMVWVFAHVSGGYFNPALTAAGLITRRLSIIRGFLFMISQIVGGIVGAGILFGVTPGSIVDHLGKNGSIGGHLGTNELNNKITSAQGFGVEVMITMVLVFAYFASHDDKRHDLKGSAPLTIGLAVVACHMFAIPFTSAGMNPARSFGPAVVLGAWEHHWVFWVGPVVGAVVAGLIYEYIFAGGATFAGVTKCLLRTKKPRQPTQADPEAEKTLLEEVKSDGIEMVDETKVDGEEKEVVEGETEVDASEKSKTGVEEATETNDKQQ